MGTVSQTQRTLNEAWTALGGDHDRLGSVAFSHDGELRSVYPVDDLASAMVGCAGMAIAELIEHHAGERPNVIVDRRLTSLWFDSTVRPIGWTLPPQRDAISGNYRAKDGWIRVHAYLPKHSAAVRHVLGTNSNPKEVAAVVTTRDSITIETDIVESGGSAAAMRKLSDWERHPQAVANSAEAVVHVEPGMRSPVPGLAFVRDRPLTGVRVLDLTRIVAGPVATRLLAGFGAEVLHLAAPGWRELALEPDLSVGKKCAFLDLSDACGKQEFERLLSQADVFVHGLRADVLPKLGYDATSRQRIRPGLIDVSLNAYGWNGPWTNRRGFDTVVQMSTGVAATGMEATGADKPVMLPVSALDHSVGYLLAAATIRGLVNRLSTGSGVIVRSSLAQMAALLTGCGACSADDQSRPAYKDEEPSYAEGTFWGPAKRLRAPLSVADTAFHWDRAAGPYGASTAKWEASRRCP